jgi:hypothetical protein
LRFGLAIQPPGACRSGCNGAAFQAQSLALHQRQGDLAMRLLQDALKG